MNDEIITTGLRVASTPNTRRRRLTAVQRQTSTSSQEEYEESESEEDHVLTSSNEHILQASRLSTQEVYDAESSSDDDDEATALGAPTFTPQPNAFSHPPLSRGPSSNSYFPPQRPTAYSRASGRSYSNQAYPRQQDHDAALRASLTTLLSCAAAARGLPKHGETRQATGMEPMGLRMVPESELLAPMNPTANSSRPLTPSVRARSSTSTASRETGDKERERSKRKASASAARSVKKKKGEVEEGLLSPTLFAWVVSAGVVVLVSVVGFGAGYVIGREVGRQEALSGLGGVSHTGGSASAACGRELARSGGGGLRRFRWGGGRSVVA